QRVCDRRLVVDDQHARFVGCGAHKPPSDRTGKARTNRRAVHGAKKPPVQPAPRVRAHTTVCSHDHPPPSVLMRWIAPTAGIGALAPVAQTARLVDRPRRISTTAGRHEDTKTRKNIW